MTREESPREQAAVQQYAARWKISAFFTVVAVLAGVVTEGVEGLLLIGVFPVLLLLFTVIGRINLILAERSRSREGYRDR